MSATRRQALRVFALAGAAVLLPLPTVVWADEKPAPPKLPPASAAEAEARYQAILKKYPLRFSAEEKAMVRKSCFDLQPALDDVRAFPLSNADEPANVFRPRR
jgi:hypothetical protein